MIQDVESSQSFGKVYLEFMQLLSASGNLLPGVLLGSKQDSASFRVVVEQQNGTRVRAGKSAIFEQLIKRNDVLMGEVDVDGRGVLLKMAEVFEVRLVLGSNDSEDRGENWKPVLLTNLGKEKLSGLLLSLIVVQLGVVDEQFVALPVSSMLSIILALQELSLLFIGFFWLQLLDEDDFGPAVLLGPVISLQNSKSLSFSVDAEKMGTSKIIVTAELSQSSKRDALFAGGSAFLRVLLRLWVDGGGAILCEFNQFSTSISSI